jgi:serine/threonine protein phosphatase 1
LATIAIGDIHGNHLGLSDLLQVLASDVAAGDTVVFLGDYVDRGPDSRAVVQRILDFATSTAAAVVCLRGNHEDWMLRTLADPTDHGWLLAMGGLATVRSYSPDVAADIVAALGTTRDRAVASGLELPYRRFWEALPSDHMAFFRNLRPSWETADCLCVHAGLNTRIARLDDQPLDAVVWGRGSGAFPRGYRGHKPVVYGHRNNAELGPTGWPLPLRVGRTIGLDTSAHGVVSALRLPDDVLYQSARH